MYKRFIDNFNPAKRIFGLDLLRFSAIILVVMGHIRWLTDSFPTPLGALLHGSGILGVELFFVLSGYLIGGILLKQFEKNSYSLSFPSIKLFWTRRWFRTLPNYYLILLVYVIWYFYHIPSTLWRYFFFVQNIWNEPPNFFEESWSLCIEEISYLISPLLLAFCARYFGKNGKGTKQYFLTISVVLIVIVTFLRMIYSAYFLQPGYKWNYHLREVALIRLDAIYYGFVAAYVASTYNDFWKRTKIPFFIFGLIAILVLMALQKSIVDGHPGLLANTFFSTVLSMAIVFIIPYLSEVKKTKFQFIAWPVTFISIISYSLYLINGGLISQSLKRYFHEGAGLSFPTALLIYISFWVACLLLSAIIYMYFEKPMTDLRNKVSFEKDKVKSVPRVLEV